MPGKKIGSIFFWLMVGAFIIYSAVFIYKTIIVVNGQRYSVLFDDAMISMQYARNLAQGAGPVFNAGGDRVEGYSNPLWVAYMAIIHLLPIPTPYVSLAIQISGLVFLVLNLILIRRITTHMLDDSPASWVVPLVAVGLTAFYYPLTQWSLLGVEVSILTLLASLAVWIVLNLLKAQKFSAWLYVLLGICTLIRIDMLGFGVMTWAFLVLVDKKNRRKNLLWGVVILGAFTLGQTAARYLYYGNILPNTYYLKMTGSPLLLRLERGVYVFFKFAWNFNLVLFLLPFLYLVFRRDRAAWYLFLAFGVQVVYSMYVGGDAWEHRGGANRFFAIVMPIFMVLFALTLEKLRRAVLSFIWNAPKPLHSRWVEPFSHAALVGMALISLLNFNILLDFNSLPYITLQKPSIYVIGQEKILRIALFARQITTPQATVLAVAAGGVPYFSERTTYDLLGKSDSLIAHEAMHIDPAASLIDFRPGHNKWDYAHSIGDLKPDLIPEIWAGTQAEADPYLKDYTVIQMDDFKQWLPNGVMYVRTGSPNIRWDLIKQYIIPNNPNKAGTAVPDDTGTSTAP
jgi:arabinofuranosyltransferase